MEEESEFNHTVDVGSYNMLPKGTSLYSSFCQEILQFIINRDIDTFMDGSSILMEIVSCISKIFSQDQEEGKYYIYNFECILASGQILGSLTHNDEINRDFNLTQKILRKLEQTVETCLKFKENPDMKIYVWENGKWEQTDQEKYIEYAGSLIKMVS